MAEDQVLISPAPLPSGANAAPIGIKVFTMVDGKLQLNDAQAIVLVDGLGRPINLATEETMQRVATSNEFIANMLALMNGQSTPY